MINGEYFASRIVGHMNPGKNKGVIRFHPGTIEKTSDTADSLYGIHFDFQDTYKGHLEIRVENNGDEDFPEKVKKIQDKEFWKGEKMEHLREKRKKYANCLDNLQLQPNGQGNYSITADIITNNRDKVFFGVLNTLIRPIIISLNKDLFK
tara:strand:+ start:9588 stop:10037 length:450 start_codon:yes stop_codon:yes gene_type:complete